MSNPSSSQLETHISSYPAPKVFLLSTRYYRHPPVHPCPAPAATGAGAEQRLLSIPPCALMGMAPGINRAISVNTQGLWGGSRAVSEGGLGVGSGVSRGCLGVSRGSLPPRAAPGPPALPEPPSGALWRYGRGLAPPLQPPRSGLVPGDTRGTLGLSPPGRGTLGLAPPGSARFKPLSGCLQMDMAQHWLFIFL